MFELNFSRISFNNFRNLRTLFVYSCLEIWYFKFPIFGRAGDSTDENFMNKGKSAIFPKPDFRETIYCSAKNLSIFYTGFLDCLS